MRLAYEADLLCSPTFPQSATTARLGTPESLPQRPVKKVGNSLLRYIADSKYSNTIIINNTYIY